MGVQNGCQRIHFLKQSVQIAFFITFDPRVRISRNICANLRYGPLHDSALISEIQVHGA